MLAMEPVEEHEIARYLNRPEFSAIPEEKKKTAIAFSGGYIGAAIEFLSEEKSEIYKKCDDFASALIHNRAAEAIRTTTFKKREDLAEFSEKLYDYFNVHLRSLSTGTSEGLNGEVRALGMKKLAVICSRLSEINDKMKFNVNVTLFSTVILSECRSAIEKTSEI